MGGMALQKSPDRDSSGIASRSGFTAWGVGFARRSGLTLIGPCEAAVLPRSPPKSALSMARIVNAVEEEEARHRRKGAREE